MTRHHRTNRCDAVLALLDECLADLDRTNAAPVDRRTQERRRSFGRR